MNHLDVYYRAWLDYRALTTKDRDCTLFRRSVSSAADGSERLVTTRNICTVDEEWICEIEKGLIYIEKAIKEDRQFIYSNGEVLPIEKVKNVSKDSVKHLAKHSNLITRYNEDEDVVPDKLYSVERLNDYAVYENGFLYMLLCYLRDFVTIRYNKILDLSNKYDGVLTIKKEIVLPKETITYSIDMHEERKDDKYLRDHNSARDVIDRMDLVLKSILALLSTPLMEYASKVAMLKPPITKTNVLKMDNNFKAAVALYDYIIAYDKDGFTTEQTVDEITPFSEELGDELSDVCALMSFLTYEHGLSIKPTLKQRYELEEQERRNLEIKQRAEQLEVIKKKLAKRESSVEEYVLALEKQVKLLEGEGARAEGLRREVMVLKETEAAQAAQLKENAERIEALNSELIENEIKHARELEETKTLYEDKINELMLKHEEELREMDKMYNDRIKTLNDERRAERESYEAMLNSLRENVRAEQVKYSQLEADHAALGEEKAVLESKLTAIRVEQGLITEGEQFTEKMEFDRLEKEYAAFTRFYQSQWKTTKKSIRKKLLNYENLKGQKGQNDEP